MFLKILAWFFIIAVSVFILFLLGIGISQSVHKNGWKLTIFYIICFLIGCFFGRGVSWAITYLF